MRARRELDAAVIGAGPGGLVTALYLARFRRNVAVFGSGTPRARWIPETHNLAGFPRGISGPALLRRLRKQTTDLGVPLIEAQAKVKRQRNGWRVITNRGAYAAKAVVLATGVEDIQPDLSNLEALRRSGQLRYCPVCDAFEFIDAPIFVLVNGAGGLGRARFLRRFSKCVHAVMLREKPASPAERRMAGSAGLELLEARAVKIRPAPKGLWLSIDGAAPARYGVGYVELGCRVRDEAFAGLRGLRRTKAGFLIADKEQRLSLPGLFAVGDCVHSLGQVSVAAGQGAIAACTIQHELLRREQQA